MKLTPKEARSAWVTALRSGEYEQDRKVLHRTNAQGDSFCCLGVACDLYQKLEGGLERSIHNGNGCVCYNGKWDVLPDEVMLWLGLNRRNGGYFINNPNGNPCDSLSSRNDNGTPFTQIAKIIESKPQGLLAKPQ